MTINNDSDDSIINSTTMDEQYFGTENKDHLENDFQVEIFESDIHENNTLNACLLLCPTTRSPDYFVDNKCFTSADPILSYKLKSTMSIDISILNMHF